MKNWKISTLLRSGFGLLTSLILLVGAATYFGMVQIEAANKTIMQKAPLVDAAMEMKLAVSNDIAVINGMLDAKDMESLSRGWADHKTSVALFDEFAGAVQEGADTKEGRIEAAQDPELLATVERADKYHDKELQPGAKAVHTGIEQVLQALSNQQLRMSALETAYNEVAALATTFEANVKRTIKERLNEGVDARYLIDTQVPWVDMAMEIKVGLAELRIALEMHSQDFTLGQPADFEKAYRDAIRNFEGWIDALLNGGSTTEGVVRPLTGTEARDQVSQLNVLFITRFKPAAEALIKANNTRREAALSASNARDAASAVVTKMKAMLDNVEDIAKAQMTEAREAGHQATASTLSLSAAVIGAGLGDSARSALVTRGFAEMQRLAAACGASPETLVGLSGLGDLILTCTSDQSRNYRFGLSLGRKESFDPSVTVEGAATARAAVDLAAHHGVEMPVTSVVADLVDGRKSVAEAMDTLLNRPLKREI